MIQKKRMNKMKTEIQSVLGGGGGRSKFDAFDCLDESLQRQSYKVSFLESDYTKLGRIKVENRLHGFQISLQKSFSMNTKRVILSVSPDPSFKPGP